MEPALKNTIEELREMNGFASVDGDVITLGGRVTRPGALAFARRISGGGPYRLVVRGKIDDDDMGSVCIAVRALAEPSIPDNYGIPGMSAPPVSAWILASTDLHGLAACSGAGRVIALASVTIGIGVNDMALHVTPLRTRAAKRGTFEELRSSWGNVLSASDCLKLGLIDEISYGLRERTAPAAGDDSNVPAVRSAALQDSGVGADQALLREYASLTGRARDRFLDQHFAELRRLASRAVAD